MKKEKEEVMDEKEPKDAPLDDSKGGVGESKPKAPKVSGPGEEAESEMGEGVKISEEFQQEAHELINIATKHECDYLRSCVSEREDALRKEEKPEKSTSTQEFGMGDAPSFE